MANRPASRKRKKGRKQPRRDRRQPSTPANPPSDAVDHGPISASARSNTPNAKTGDAKQPLIPPGRGPLIALFLTITIGSIVVWSFFIREPNLQQYTYQLVRTYPHDVNSFTQGLYYRDGYLYESTGQRGQSKARKIKLETGEVIRDVDLDEKYFGEGIAAVGDKLIQLTWESETGFVYDFDLNRLDQFTYDGQGWGLTFDGQFLIMSDGTSELTFLDPQTFQTIRQITVRKGTRRLPNLNELEYINGLIYANVWYEDIIYLISPENGNVIGQLDLRGLYPSRERSGREAVLNGIAIHPENGTLLVTGKYWPNVFEIQPVKADRK